MLGHPPPHHPTTPPLHHCSMPLHAAPSPLLLTTTTPTTTIIIITMSHRPLPTDPKSRNACLGRTPLILAIKQTNLPLTTRLLARGCDVNLCDHSGWPPLHYAISKFAAFPCPTSQRILVLLISYGADLETCNSCGLNAARLAATNPGYLPLVAYLVARGASIGGVDIDGEGIGASLCVRHIPVVGWLARLSTADPRREMVCRRFCDGERGDEAFGEYLLGLM